MLTTVDSHIKYRALDPLKNRAARSLYNSLDNVLRRYNWATIYVTSVDSDIEFKSLFKDVEDNMDTKLTMSLRASMFQQPNATTEPQLIAFVWPSITCLITTFLACCSSTLLFRKLRNSIGSRLRGEGGLSDTFTHHQFLELPPIDWNKDVKILQGSHCQAFTEPAIKNDLKQRTRDMLFLTPTKNKQGGYVMLNLATNKEVTSTRITQVPITDLVIQTVKELAAQDGMTPLKIENCTHTVI